MNILICSSVWAPSIGGVQSVMGTLARGLVRESVPGDKQAIDLTIATRAPATDSRDQDGSLHVVRDTGIFRLLRLIWESDVVHLAGPALLPLFLAWLLRKKAVLHHHGYQAVCPDGSLIHFADRRVCCNSFAAAEPSDCLRCRTAKLGRVRGLISVALAYPRLWLCRRVAANIAVSHHVSDRLALPRSTTIYNAPADCDESPFVASHPSVPASIRVANSEVPLFAFVGRLTSEKGVSILLRAASALAAEDIPLRVRIIGDGPELARLAVLAWTLRIRDVVEFTGVLDGVHLEEALSPAVGIVLPSLVEETAGLVAIEQMMRGRLVIASDIGGLAEIVGDAGLKFPAGDVGALAACMRRVLADPSLRVTLGRAARSRALEHFTQQRMVQDHLQLYRRILQRKIPIRPPAA
jgi:glycosyltransferase involved in cell wall biosynthesis